MQMTELIGKKRDGGRLSAAEIDFMIQGYTNGSIPDYQMSAMCMAILLKGMDEEEILNLTLSMVNSGDTLDLSAINGLKADKHSTGGVGDKTSLVLCPMVAACGVKIAKMSGRGLGHTGGTIDKLESFPGFSTEISDQQFFKNVNELGIAIIGQTAELVPADKKIYALRDVTATVPSIPLMSSSIMSKKLAAGADVIVLDVKCGDGAFMKTEADARVLAETMTKIGKGAGRHCAAVITDMDQPLGWAIGNALEVKEAISVLRGEMGGDLLELCLALGSCMLTVGGFAPDNETAANMLREAIASGRALEKLADMIEGQGGSRSDVYDTSRLPAAPVVKELYAVADGYVSSIAAEDVGLVSMQLGGGRATKESSIDLSVGIILKKKVGEFVHAGESLAQIHAADSSSAEKAAAALINCFAFSAEPVLRPRFIKDIVM